MPAPEQTPRHERVGVSETGSESGAESSAAAAESSGSEVGEGSPAEASDASGTERADGESAGGESAGGESTPVNGGDSATAGIEGGESSAEDNARPPDHTEPGENGPAQEPAPGPEDTPGEGAPVEAEPNEAAEPAEPPEPGEQPEPADPPELPNDAADLDAVQPDLAGPASPDAPEAAEPELSEPNGAEVLEAQDSGFGEPEETGSTDPEANLAEAGEAEPDGPAESPPEPGEGVPAESVAENDDDGDALENFASIDTNDSVEVTEATAEAPDAEPEESAGSAIEMGETGEPAGPPDMTAPKAAEPEALETAGGDKTIERDTATNQEIDEVLGRVNPYYERTDSAYSENCTGVVQANELQRRGVDVQARPLEPELRKDHGGPGGRPLSAVEQPWGREFTPGTKSEIEAAFQEPGSRGVVYIQWNTEGAHVFNVENVGGTVRFVDGQTIPPRTDASSYFDLGDQTRYLRLDDLPTPPSSATAKYVETRDR